MIVCLEGGMGNQLFQMAFGYSVAERRNEQLFFNRRRLESDPNGRVFELHHFRGGKDMEFRDEEPPVVADNWYFNQTVWTQGKTFTGHWQTEKYFDAPLVRCVLRVESPISKDSYMLGHKIINHPSAFLHIRRTDYLTPAALACHGNVGIGFYRNAMDYIRAKVPKVNFYVFSDDPEWCRGAFPDCTVVGHNQEKAYEDLWLMSLCQHAVFPNSTFGWWGAWLGDHKLNRIVIGPKRWFVIGQNSADVIPGRWMKFDNLD
jgi:hypothetical protein